MGSLVGAQAQDRLVFEEGDASIEYVPFPQPPAKRKKLAQKNQEKQRGWVVGFLAHEMGHVLMNLAYGHALMVMIPTGLDIYRYRHHSGGGLSSTATARLIATFCDDLD